MTYKTRSAIFFLSGLVLGIIAVAAIALKKSDPGIAAVDVSADGRPQYRWYAPAAPADMVFCGEAVPLGRPDVKEKLERELLSNAYQFSTQLYIMKLSGRYFPAIERELKNNGVPDDFKYVCIAESALNQNAISATGAASFWQFMKDTAPRYGLEITDEVDERFNVVKATDAACIYFKEAYAKFGTWTSAAASYNCGQAGYANQCAFQEAGNYYDLIFPDETNRYIYRILALKYILTHPKNFGFYLDQAEAFQPLKSRTARVESSIENLTAFAKQNNTTYKMLKMYNPWLRAHKLTVKPGKAYEIELPAP